MAIFTGGNDSLLQGLGEESQFFVAVDLGTVTETSGPSEDTSNRVGASATSLLPDTVVSCDGTMSGLSLHNTVLVDADTGHETEGTESLCDDITLDITIVVLASPDETTIALEDLSNHIVNETVLVVNTLGLVLLKEFLFIDLLEGIFEKTIILLQDSVLGRKLKRQLSIKGIVQARASKGGDRVSSVEHTEVGTSLLEVVDFLFSRCTAIIGGENKFDFTSLVDNVILATVLVTVSVSTDNDRLGPAGHQSGDVLDNNRFSENGTIKDVSNSSVRRSPHLLEFELFNTTLIRSDSGTLDTNLVLLHGVSAINSDLIVSLITRGDTQIIVFGFKVDVRMDMFFLDPVPDNSGHFITVDIDNRLGNLDLAESGEATS
mmetsp:Transcript_97472/g.134064  ORF Transcript_97472/g.134064 Transcript_97472/m.134064 type:complete len:376 (-) Transcript_97472:86-1213(-)